MSAKSRFTRHATMSKAARCPDERIDFLIDLVYAKHIAPADLVDELTDLSCSCRYASNGTRSCSSVLVGPSWFKVYSAGLRSLRVGTDNLFAWGRLSFSQVSSAAS